MSDTPETDAKSFIAFDTEGRKLVVVLATTSESFERERDEAREIIRLAKAKFCEEGSDGNIASEMFSILSGAK
jgi:hypothetical protein